MSETRPPHTSAPRHPDFEELQASRPRPSDRPFTMTQTACPGWRFGSGANKPAAAAEAEEEEAPPTHIAIDPFAADRAPPLNYKLLVSAITPRPIALLSTLSPSPGGGGGGGGEANLAPFSYFNLVNHDPPLFVIGFVSSPRTGSGTGSGTRDRAKDSLRNLLRTREAVINIISEDFAEAANATSVDAPPGVSEWDVCGLTPVRDCELVSPPRVREAVFSIEARLESVREWESRASPGQMSGAMVVLEGVRFWARRDGVNAEGSLIDPAVLRPIGRMGGITYSRTNEAFELPRPRFEEDIGGHAGLDKIKIRSQSSQGGVK
ncbi:hypothetical protein E4U41_006870 [Claviceps citrina]|nr:hypothetical protein E4U41_006870 [Claviceps citrina]